VGTRGHSVSVRRLTASETSARIGDRRAFADVSRDGEVHLVISDHPIQSVSYVLSGFVGKNPAVDGLAAASCGNAFLACPPQSASLHRSCATWRSTPPTPAQPSASPPWSRRPPAQDHFFTGPVSIFDIASKVRSRDLIDLHREAKLDNRSRADASDKSHCPQLESSYARPCSGLPIEN